MVAKTAQERENAAQAARRTAQMEMTARLDEAESRARTEKMRSEAAEADIRRKVAIFEKRNIFWRATHNLSDVA
ncbi:MAG: hypothetical protein LBI39_03235 [Puniceicoccales bacterium]|jgi:hypothetical protein|nr:hypothetical protein [Puniceicoccales bacterium]